MKIGIAIVSRFNSTRLPGKALIEIYNKTLLQHIIDRVSILKPEIDYCIATSDSVIDEPIINFCRTNEYKYFRGSLNNVAHRLLSCALKNNWDYIIRINGDNLFVEVEIIKDLISQAKTDRYDFLSNVPERSYPYGMSVEILKTTFFSKTINSIKNLFDQEHVTSWFYKNESIGSRYYLKNENLKHISGLKLAIDNEEDVKFANKIFNLLPNVKNIQMKDISDLANQGLI